MSNHPLNLQVQLVASSGRERILTRSANSSRETFNDTGDQPANGSALKRTPSVRSNRSDTESTYSASSLASGASGSGSGSSSGRRMIPLYNLHAHNVMTNVITDAGTDAKIAKFFKRGLEIMGLAMLEPVEVYGKYNWNDSLDTLDQTGAQLMNSTSGSGFGNQVSRTISQISSLSMQRDGNPVTEVYHDLPTVVEVPSPTTPRPIEKESNSKKLFANMFKKKKDPPAPLALNPNPEPSLLSAKRKSVTPSFMISSPKFGPAPTPTTANILSPTGSMLIPSTSSGGLNSASGPGDNVLLQPQVLGLQAVVSSPTGAVPTKGRPTTYAWVVRKWIKGSDEGLIGAMVDSLGTALTGSGWGNQPGGPGGMGGADVEVRFEWRRGSKGKSAGSAEGGDRRKRNATGSTIGGEDKGSRRHSIALDISSNANSRVASESGAQVSNGLAPPPLTGSASKRLSLQAVGSPNKRATIPPEANGDSLQARAGSPNPPASIQTNATDENAPRNGGAAVEDEDSDSDIEDSERPWNCYLHIRGSARLSNVHSASESRTASRRGSRDELGHPDEEGHPKDKMLDIKLRVACLAPAPHHPKVVSQIKTPYPLPDVVFDPSGTNVETSSASSAQDLTTRAAMLRPRDVDGSKSDVDVNRAGTITGLVLSAEEIKDIVSCTGLWLVVREGYGGLARKRKGDGWRLRG